MKHRNDRGFWPSFMSDAWTIIPPIILDAQYVKETLLIKGSFEEIFKEHSKIIRNLEIVAINEVQTISDRSDFSGTSIVLNRYPHPHFSERQQEIALYAARHGYYEFPKIISAEALADKFNISISALNEHLRKVERTAMLYFFS
jgi:predicted DNA binding protein